MGMVTREVGVCDIGVVDSETGEVLYYLYPVSWDDSKWGKVSKNGVSIDDIDISDPLCYEKWVVGRDGYKLVVRYQEELVEDSRLSMSDIRLLVWLGGMVKFHNIVYVEVKAILDKLSLSKGQVSKSLSKLEEYNYLKLEHKNSFGVGTRVVAVHPRYWWKGNSVPRERMCITWAMRDSYKGFDIMRNKCDIYAQ